MKRILATLLLSWIWVVATAQQDTYITYGRDEGLPQSQVRAIATDSTGFLWVGTLGGLSRFDGMTFVNFSKEDGLPDNQINCLLPGRKLWIGTTGNLCYADGRRIACIPFPAGYEAARVSDIAEGHGGELWIATAGEGLLLFDRDSSWTAYSRENGLPDDYVRSICTDKSGRLWIGTRSGIVTMDSLHRIHSSPNTDLKNLSISRIRNLKNGYLVVSTFGNGVFIHEGDRWINLTEADGLPGNYIRSFVETGDDKLWFGSKDGLAMYAEGVVTPFDESRGMPYDNVKSLGTDREGNLWIGTDGKGLLLKAGSRFSIYTTDEGLSSNLIMSFAKGSGDTLYLGTYDAGISVLAGDSAFPHEVNPSLPSQTVWCLHRTGDALLVGTSSGLFIDRGSHRSSLDVSNGLPGNRVMCIDTWKDELYVGTDNGVVKMKPSGEILEVYDRVNDSPVLGVRGCAKNERNLFFGGEGAVWKLSENDLQAIPSSLDRETSVYCLEYDERGNLWVGTSDGLFVLHHDADSLESVSLSPKNASRNINFLKVPGNGTLLVGSNNGLDAINLREYHRQGTLSTIHYGRFEGLTGAETNQNAVLADQGVVWFGTTSGAVRFTSERERKLSVAPGIYIADIRLFLEDVEWDQIVDSVSHESGLPLAPSLKYNQNYLTFDYSGIYFSNPEKIRYEYKLEGVDENWLGPTESRSATYAYLPHGNYTFRVKAYQVDAPALREESSFSFSILPPFYLTNWFFALVFLALIGVMYLIYSARLRKEREKQANLRLQLQSKLMQLESQSLNSSMNRHFIFNALNSIQYYINMQDRKSANRYLTSFAKLIRKNLDSSLKADTSLSDELERLKLYLSLEQMRFQDKFDYRIDISPEIDLDAVSLPAMMLQPFLENSIWHGILPSRRKGMIEIRITDEGMYYNIRIDDNGVGIDTSLKQKSIDDDRHVSKGMEITLSRINLYQNMTGRNYQVEGPYERKDEEGHILGTRISIRLPKKSTIPELNGHASWKIKEDKLN
jgi:ligand-binding sensor domain-containing protein/cbb3-type cytochrome oxidase subunit 3